MAGNGGLGNDGGMLGVDTSSDEQCGKLMNVRAQFFRFLIDSDGVEIYDAKNAFVIVLDFDPVLEGAKIVSDVEVAGGLNPGQDTSFHLCEIPV